MLDLNTERKVQVKMKMKSEKQNPMFGSDSYISQDKQNSDTIMKHVIKVGLGSQLCLMK